MNTTDLRSPPHSIEAKLSVIGGILLKNNVYRRVVHPLTDGDFDGDDASSANPATLRSACYQRRQQTGNPFTALINYLQLKHCVACVERRNTGRTTIYFSRYKSGVLKWL